MTDRDVNSYGLTSAQSEIYLHQLSHPELPLYNIGGYIQVVGALDYPRMAAAYKAFILSSDVFSNQLGSNKQGEPIQFSAGSTYADLKIVDFSSESDPRACAETFAKQALRQKFNLLNAFLYSVTLIKLAENESWCLMVCHHVFNDGWSFVSCLKRIVECYNAQTGECASFEMRPRYLDFVKDELLYVGSPLYEKHKKYWLNKLKHLPPRPLEAKEGGRFEAAATSLNIVARIEGERYKQLSALAGSCSVGIHHVLLALVFCYFSRVYSAAELIVGVPSHNRRKSIDKDTAGMFASVYPFLLNVPNDITFSELVARITAQTKSDYRYQRFPVSHLSRELGLFEHQKRGMYDIAFNFEKFDAPLSLADLDFKIGIISNGHSQIPINFIYRDFCGHQSNELIVEYNTAFFSAGEAVLLIDRFWWMLSQLTPSQPLQSLSIIPPAEELLVTNIFNQTYKAYPRELCLPQWFESVALHCASKIAVRCGELYYSYEELNNRANQLAHYLLDAGISPETLVGVCLERSLDLLVGVLGILKAGGAYLPLDPSYPSARLAHMVADSGVNFILAHRAVATALPGCGVFNCLYLDDALTQQQLRLLPVANPAQENTGLTPSHLAYVIYTSGSTGIPKGVMIEHASLLNFLQAMQDRPGLTADDVLLSVTSPSFDIHALEFYLPLISGATVVIAKENQYSSAEALASLMVEFDVTVMQATPVTWSLLADSPWQPLGPFKALCGGETLSQGLRHKLQSRAGLALWNLYGPTEATVWSTVQLVGEHISLGKPIPNTQCYVLSDQLQLQPLGITGELCIAGAGIARGYWQRPELSAKQFVANPFSDRSSSRLYRTGDRVRWTPCGELEYVGRSDEQIKVRGLRIELGEIEHRISEHTAVRLAAVCAQEDPQGQSYLVAYVVKTLLAEHHTDAQLSADLRAHLRRWLPDYMLPSTYVILVDMPLTPNGKIDKQQLPRPDRAPPADHFAAPKTATELALAVLWCEVLEQDSSNVSASANFFELGGHSLAALRLIGLLRTRFNVELSLRDLFDCSDLSDMAAIIDRANSTINIPRLKTLTPRPKRLLSSYGQQSLWLYDQLNGGSAEYNMTGGWRIEGDFEEALAEQALCQLIERHAVLRTTFEETEAGVAQEIADAFRFELQRLDMCLLPEDERDSAVANALFAEKLKPFNLACDLLLRASLLKLAASDYVLLVSVHHIACDGWSLDILQREFFQLYNALVHKAPYPLAPLNFDYIDYVYWQRDWLANGVLTHQLNYWRQQLAGIPLIHSLPLDKPRPKRQTFAGAGHNFVVPAEVFASLKILAGQQRVSIFMLLHGVFSVLLARYSNCTDIVIASPVAGRTADELEPLVGLFFNTLVLRSNVSGNPSFIDYLRHIRDINLAAQANLDAPIGSVIERLDVGRDPSYSPVFQVMLVMADKPIADMSADQLKISALEEKHHTAKFDLSLHIVNHRDYLACTIEYRTDLFEDSTIARMSESFCQLLHSVIEQPSDGIHTLPMLTIVERQELAARHNTQGNFSGSILTPQLIEAQVLHHPSKVALWCGQTSYTYVELNARANQLAHYLISAGVKPDTLVGVCVERSVDTLVALLGILKAGGAYLPLDPNYPAARLAYMLADSGVGLIVAHRSAAAVLLANAAPEILYLDDEQVNFKLQQFPICNPAYTALGLTPTNLAYVIYTSGSTGSPKGVMIEHHSLSNFLQAMRDTPSLDVDDVLLSVTSPSFDIHTLEFYLPLIVGATLIVATQEQYSDAEVLARLIAHFKVTVMQATPVTWSLLVDSSWQPTRPFKALCGGEALSHGLRQKLQSRRGLSLWNLYGPTETTVWSTVGLIGERITLGQPIANTQCYVVNEHLALQPVGVAGELCIAGEGVARGYWQQPDLTHEKFIPNPFGSEPSTLYRTGDWVRRTSSGELEYVARRDDQVKIRGFRIELGDIEHHLDAHVSVLQSIVCANDDRQGRPCLVAYIVKQAAELETPDADNIAVLRAHLRHLLPDHMVPNAFVFLSAFPLTPNGKIDRKQLLKLESLKPQSFFIAPGTDAELRLAILWSEVLDLDINEISASASFFELGGDSLSALTFVRKARKLGFNYSTDNIRNAQTISNLAKLDSKKPTAVNSEYCGPIAMTADQLAFINWPYGTDKYCINLVVDTNFAASVETLKRACREVVNAHDGLRSVFHYADKKWHANIVLDWDYDLAEEIALPFLWGDPAALVELKIIFEKIHGKIVLGRGPKFYVALVTDLQGAAKICFSVTHLVCDAYGMQILLEDILLAYEKITNDQAVIIERSSSYADALQKYISYINSSIYMRQIDYWESLRWSELKVHPIDYPENFNAKRNVAKTSKILAEELSEHHTRILLQEVRTFVGVSPLDFMIAILVKVFAAWSGSDSQFFSVFDAGRESLYKEAAADMSRVVSSSNVFRSLYLHNPDYTDMVGYVTDVERQIRGIPFGGTGLHQLREACDNISIKSRIAKCAIVPDSGIWFNYSGINGSLDYFKNKGLSVSNLTYEVGCVTLNDNFPRGMLLQLPWQVSNNRLMMFWEYSDAVHKDSTIRELARRCKDQLTQWLDDVAAV